MKTRGRRTLLKPKLQKQICKLLAQGHTIATVCEAVGIAERTYYDWREKHLHFSQAATCAIGQSKVFLVEKLRRADDWRAQAFLLERRWPNEFGRTVERTLPKEPESEAQGPSIEFSVLLRDGTRIPTTFQEAQKVFADFPIVETPTELATNDDDDLGSNENENGLSPNEYPNESPS
jgi:hypothetical protein